jgi:DNA polymerase elongation subunit (family B)
MRCLPAQVQLSQKIRDRGGRVDVGTRLEYVIVTHPLGEKAKQYEQIESYDYYKDHAGSIAIDFNYYLKALSKPIDQLLSAVFKTEKFMTNQYKRVLLKKKVVKEIIDLSKPKITFL